MTRHCIKFYFFSNLDWLGFDEPKTTNNTVDSTINYGVGAVTYFDSWRKQRFSSSSSSKFINTNVSKLVCGLEIPCSFKNATTSWHHFLYLLKYTMLFWSFSLDRNLEKNLEIKLEVVLDSLLQNVKHDLSPTFEILQQMFIVFPYFFHESNFYVFFFQLILSKFFHKILVTHFYLLKCMKIGKFKKKQLFTIDIMPS